MTAAFAETPFAPGPTVLAEPNTYGDTIWGDYDGDGDLDALLYGRRINQSSVSLFRNDAGAFVDTGIALGHLSGYGAWGDYDGDGDLDLVVGGSSPVRASHLYRNDAGPFSLVQASINGGGDGAVAWGDYDNDGDLDLVVAGWNGSYFTTLYRNDAGTLVDASAGLPGAGYGALAWGDIDGDGDLDLAVMDGTVRTTRVFLNDGGRFAVGAQLAGGYGGSLAWGDYDNDGDLDLAAGGIRQPDTVTQLYRNDGGTLVDSGVVFPYKGPRVSWADFDGDGDLDLLVTGNDYERNAPFNTLYANDGGAFSEVFTGLPDGAAATWGDYDNDGRLDLLVGVNWSGLFRVYRNVVVSANTPPSAPLQLTASAEGSRVDLDWQAATDAQTAPEGLSYNVRVGTTDEGSEVMSAMADAGTGYRRVVALGNAGPGTSLVLKGLPPGQYYWAVQAIDTSFAGSAFAETASFMVEPRVLAVAKEGAGSGLVTSVPAGVDCGGTCDASFPLDMVVTLTAQPDSGSVFAGWSGACTGTGTCAPTMDGDKSVVATFVLLTLSVDDANVTEGDSGTTTAALTVSLSAVSGHTVTVDYATADDTATTAGGDYEAASGTLTFASGVTTQPLPVTVKGDTVDEPNERLLVTLSNPANATLARARAFGTIVDDDGPGGPGSAMPVEISHGLAQRKSLAALPGPAQEEHFFLLAQKPYSSYELVVDEISGDLQSLPGQPLAIDLLAADGATVGRASRGASSLGHSRSLRWANSSDAAITDQRIRIRSGGCTTECGAEDEYRLRFYETTYAVSRFNNTGGQTTVLILQNPTAEAVNGMVFFWGASSTLVASQTFAVSPGATLNLNTSTVSGAAGQSGSMTIANDGPYGALSGKAVALDSATGFSFDSPLVARLH